MSATRVAFILRPLEPGDDACIARLIGDWEVARWLSAPPFPYDLADAEAFIAANDAAEATGDSLTRAIVIDGLFAGMAGVDRRSLGMNLGYWLGRRYWGRGIMSRTAAVVTAEFFANSSEDLLNSGYFSGNEASAAIQRKLGFIVTGDGMLFSRPSGKRMPHVQTVLTREHYMELQDRELNTASTN